MAVKEKELREAYLGMRASFQERELVEKLMLERGERSTSKFLRDLVKEKAAALGVS